ncbi:TPA: mannose-1-phosphate guanylyltransferase/mannose-6-phosphate isomerase [Legionella pneumophila subsp. pneumophila]|uniref:mannose-1-phosphate guanylyltransferase n=3 Tax=Legionella pneumophila TaxID=446 RepID=A0A3A6UMY1_LEGPN|nr:phosphomannose isomerase [Legionella pneumophila str. 121004]ERH42081.1 phosphomannose isomerase [Legionella pneumophila str. Leg01/53]ERH45050.1 phosphomannose isomerase [Legionella pneumophila str. Leg01/11]ERI47894.1 phosphomannose isomerase [Legionella pneumophila str. Leg01/20]PPK26200.1 mannose-1-phosphate guanylyltransferase/mannose-6-phosphate isomerase [Legionella pneumophila]RJY25241.1 mannose-1-phosphate guanylyltransferase/mannose-6-phosphate isomerase [Legionella pneumophila su
MLLKIPAKMQVNYATIWNVMTTPLYPIILAGGSGTRLWPLSRQNFPKQFLKLNGELSLIQQTMKRAMGLPGNQTIIVSNDAHYFICQDQLKDFNAQTTYLLEPCARNTAPAIACAAHYLANTVGKDAVMLVLPSDHWIADDEIWLAAMLEGGQFASENNAIVTFGIKPDSPKTGYGYIEAGTTLFSNIKQVLSFREKPDAHSAAQFVSKGNYFWNSGMFICRAGVYLEELEQFEANIYQFSQQALTLAQHHHDFLRLDLDCFSQCKEESIDYAIMEKTDKAVVIPISIQWSDLGCWTAVADANKQDEQGNTLIGNVIAQDSHNCLINSEELLVTTVGIQDQIIVATSDAVLVADKRYSQQVKDLVHSLRKDHPHLTQDHQRVPRPWGYYEVLAEGTSFKVKRLMVKPGAKLSLQTHQHRAEHWVIVGGEAEVVNGNNTFRLSKNQSTYIPKNALHRLSNPHNEPLYVIEVQSGSYLGEDDIKRFDDIYLRKEVELAE